MLDLGKPLPGAPSSGILIACLLSVNRLGLKLLEGLLGPEDFGRGRRDGVQELGFRDQPRERG